VSGSHAWQNPAGNPSPQVPSAAVGVPPYAGSQVGAPAVSQHANRPPVGYQPPYTQSQDGTSAQAGEPNYPYPPYHNPYYEGPPTRNLLTDAVEWIVAVPSNVMGNFCDFLDRRVFPNVPATSGGAQRGASESSTKSVPAVQTPQGGSAQGQPR
jgi:hypothetical protein